MPPEGIYRMCIHWNAGTYKRTQTEINAYHFTCDNNGIILPGRFKPEDNLIKPKYGKLLAGQYAAHLGGGNTGTLGFAFLAMGNYKGRSNVGKYPLTQKQCEAGWKFLGHKCIEYKINPLDPEKTFTHYEFGKRNPDTSSRGKVDINFLPFEPDLSPDRIGDYIRTKINWYMIQKQKELGLI